MKPKEFELQVIKIIKKLRHIKNEKQINFANALAISESNYWKIEAGEKAITLEQLKLISNYIGISYHRILSLADTDIAKYSDSEKEIS